MAYVGERLYNEFIRKKMSILASHVKVREIVPYLPCLTITDREEIEAKRETAGNYTAMMLLLDNLRRRENWPDQFISALRQCEHQTLADEISEVYDGIKGIPKRPAPAPAPAPAAAHTPAPFPAEAVRIPTTATIHSTPNSNPPLLTPSVEGPTHTANLSHINRPPRPCDNIAAPAVTEAPALVSAPDAAVHVPPESAQPAEPPLLVIESGPPGPISAPPFIYQSEDPVGVKETSKLVVSGASAPVNSESCFNADSPALSPAIVSAQEASVQLSHESAYPAEPPLLVVAPHSVPPSPVSAPELPPSVGQSEVPVSCIETPTLGMSGDLMNTANPGAASVAVSTIPINATSTSSQANKPSTTPSALPEKSKVAESSISVKHPIQDSSPPRIVIPQDAQNKQTNNQVVERVNTAAPPNFQIQKTAQGAAQALPSASPNTTAHCLDNLPAENQENFSKPGVLRGEEPCSVSSDLQISHRTTEHRAPSNQNWADEPVDGSLSVTTDNLMISSSTTTVSTQDVSGPVAPVENSFYTAQENGSTEGANNFCLNQPVEDHYESSCQSFQAEHETREHLVEFSERPSVQNLSGQPPCMVGPSTIGLKHNAETENLVQSVSVIQTSQHQKTQCIQENNSSEQAISAVEPGSATYQELELNKSGQINNPRSEQGEEFQGLVHRFRSNQHLIGAAAVGVIAVFLALRLKH